MGKDARRTYFRVQNQGSGTFKGFPDFRSLPELVPFRVFFFLLNKIPDISVTGTKLVII